MTSKRAPWGWKKRVRRILLNAISLGRVCMVAIEADDALSSDPKIRRTTEKQALSRKIHLLEEELRLKDDRMAKIPPRNRPHYSPAERMQILELRAARGWSSKETADRFHVSDATVSAWQRIALLPDEATRVQLREPVNKFPDVYRQVAQKLKVMCPRLGKDKIAEMLCRAGVKMSPSTVGRILKEKPTKPAAPKPTQAKVTAKAPNDAWLIDLTAVPIGGFGFWVPWIPFSLPQCWPFCYWVGAVMDMYSRRIQGVVVFCKEPTSKQIRSFLNRVVAQVGVKPRIFLSDHDPVFMCQTIRVWCGKQTRPRYGAVGQKGSIALLERFFLTYKSEFTRRILVSLRAKAFRRETQYFVEWYNKMRPHSALDGVTPEEVYVGRRDEIEVPTYSVLQVSFHKRRRHLPVLTVRRAAA